MNHDEWLERAELYALGVLDGEEQAQFEAHLSSGCPSCEHLIRGTRETLTLLPRSLPPIPPPPAVKARLLQQIAKESTATTFRRLPFSWWWGLGVGAMAAAVVILTLTWSLVTTRRELQRLEGRLADLQVSLAQQEEVLRLLADPLVRFVQLAGLPPSPAATARLLWNPSNRSGLLLASGLPQAPPDRVYELWAIAGTEPSPAGTFRVDQSGRGTLRLPVLPQTKPFDKFAVTLEPAGGVPSPTGPMHLLGSL